MYKQNLGGRAKIIFYWTFFVLKHFSDTMYFENSCYHWLANVQNRLSLPQQEQSVKENNDNI